MLNLLNFPDALPNQVDMCKCTHYIFYFSYSTVNSNSIHLFHVGDVFHLNKTNATNTI